jgi:hypothetical protein
LPVYEELEIDTAASPPIETEFVLDTNEFILETSADRATVYEEFTPAPISDEFILDTSAEPLPVAEWKPKVEEVEEDEDEEPVSDIPDILAPPVSQPDAPSHRWLPRLSLLTPFMILDALREPAKKPNQRKP